MKNVAGTTYEQTLEKGTLSSSSSICDGITSKFKMPGEIANSGICPGIETVFTFGMLYNDSKTQSHLLDW